MRAFVFQLGFGKPIPSDCVWVEGISDTVSEKYLATQFNKFGRVLTTYIDRRTGRALVYYDTQEQAVIAVNEMRGKYVAERKIQVFLVKNSLGWLSVENFEAWLRDNSVAAILFDSYINSDYEDAAKVLFFWSSLLCYQLSFMHR